MRRRWCGGGGGVVNLRIDAEVLLLYDAEDGHGDLPRVHRHTKALLGALLAGLERLLRSGQLGVGVVHPLPCWQHDVEEDAEAAGAGAAAARDAAPARRNRRQIVRKDKLFVVLVGAVTATGMATAARV